MPEAVEPARRHRPAQQQARHAARLGRQLRAPCQPHPVIRRLADPVIFDDHGSQPFGTENVLERGKAGAGAGGIDNQQASRIKPERRKPGRIEHARPATRRRRTPDNRSRLVGLRENPPQQRHRKPRQRPVMARPAAQHMDTAEGQTTGKRRIERFDTKRQARTGKPPVNRGNLAAQHVETAMAREINIILFLLIYFRNYAACICQCAAACDMCHDEFSCRQPLIALIFCSCFVLA